MIMIVMMVMILNDDNYGVSDDHFDDGHADEYDADDHDEDDDNAGDCHGDGVGVLIMIPVVSVEDGATGDNKSHHNADVDPYQDRNAPRF